MPAKRRESKRKDDSLGAEAEQRGTDMKGKVTKPSASPMRKKATAQLLREKGKDVKADFVASTPLGDSPTNSSPAASPASQQAALEGSSDQRPKTGAFASGSNKNGKRMAAVVRSPVKRTRMMTFVNQSPEKEQRLPQGAKRSSPKQQKQQQASPALKPVPTKSFYEVVATKSFKEFDADLVLAPAFMVEKDGRLMRSEQVELMKEMEDSINELESKATAQSNRLASLEKENKRGEKQKAIDKLTAELEKVNARLESLNGEYVKMSPIFFYNPDGMPIQISAASTVSGLEGEVMTLKRCLVPRAFFKRSSKDKAKQQASYAARVLAREYSA